MDIFLYALLGAIVGATGGGAIAYLWTERRARSALTTAQTAAALAQQQATSLDAQLQTQRTETQQLRLSLSTAEKQVAALTAQEQAAQTNLHEQCQLLDQANTKLTTAFASVSQEALANANTAFLQMAQTRFQTLSTQATGDLETRKAQVETLIKPMTELLLQYQQRLGEIEKNRTESYGALQKQIGSIAEVERALSQQTGQLVSALTKPNVRGQWGEITLRRLVELAGMTNRCDFFEQTHVATDEGRLRPDMLVQLPGNRSIVIDAKAVMGAFLDAAAAADEPARRTHLQRHSQLVRNRAKDLSSKVYWAQFDNTPEFVVLFLPGESFLYAAVENDPGLIEECLATKVILATPTTLIALLKTVEFGWRQEAVSRNAEEIRKLGTEIYDRLAVLANHMDKVGSGLDGVINHYNAAVKSLESRLLVSARKMGELGVAPSKPMLDELTVVDHRPQELGATLKPDKSPLLPE